MNASDFTYLLNHPEAVNEKRTDELDKIVTEFPYFQGARALRLKGLYNEDSFRYNYALKVTAAFTADRSVLFDFITSENFTSVDKNTYVKKQEELHNIDVSPEPEVEELKMDDSFRASLDTEFIAVEEIENDASKMASAEIEEVAPTEFETAEEEIEEEAIEEEYVAEEFISEESKVPEFDPATKSVLDSIKEAEQYARSLSVTDVEEVIAVQEIEPEIIEETEVEIAPVIENTPEKLEIGKPLEFSQNETHSFHEWLQLSQFQPIVRDDVAPDIPEATETTIENDASETDPERQKKNELIDKFIETNPKIPKVQQDAKPVSFIFEPSQSDNSYLMTETLARVYLEQKKFDKAVQAYQILILKYPEKSSFFADRILDIRILQQNNKLQ